MHKVVKTDFLVVGSGIAGLSFAIRASKYGKVTIVTKKEIMESNTNLAQGGIAAVMGKDDSFTLHINDTIRNGCGLCDRKAVELVVKNGPSAINWLIAHGVNFDENKTGLALGMEGGHSKKRIVHRYDYTGKEIEESLVKSVRDKDIDVYENYFVLDIIVKNRRAYGLEALDLREEKRIAFLSKVTALATGGLGQIYSQTSNPNIATGDGIAMAYRAGVKLGDLEFIQFHPTTLKRTHEPNFLVSEAIRGEGGILRNYFGEPFMGKYHEAKDLAPRDIVSRAVFEELKNGKVYLDISHRVRSFIMKRFPTIYRECLHNGIDIAKDQIPITPAAHYLCGGIKVNLYGESSIAGLFAFGEAAFTGVHGANRLASNSLLESVVFSARGIKKAKQYLDCEFISSIPRQRSIEFGNKDHREDIKRELQDLMWKFVGVIRTVDGLSYATSSLRNCEEILERINNGALHSSVIELRNMVTVAKLIAKAAYIRRESRGTHYLTEYPAQDDEKWSKNIIMESDNIQII